MSEEEVYVEDSMDLLRKYMDNYGYVKGFYWGFNLNKVPEGMEGIYVLYGIGDKVLYVGESVYLKTRLKKHIYKGINGDFIIRVRVIPFNRKTTKMERCLVERSFINLLNPVHNRTNRNGDKRVPENIELNIVDKTYNQLQKLDRDELESY